MFNIASRGGGNGGDVNMNENSEIGLKRNLESRSNEDSFIIKRGKIEIPSVISIPSTTVAATNSTFDMEMLRIYYSACFPCDALYEWLKDGFTRREFAFQLPGEVFCRYQSFVDASDMRSRIIEAMPERMEIGAVFSQPPKHKDSIDNFAALERDLIFDIDMDEYDDIRTCCSGAQVCEKCWTFVKAAISVLDETLRTDFGFKKLLFVFSGRRGVHCWVSDPEARKLSNEQRAAVAEYLNLINETRNGVKTCKINKYGCNLPHPLYIRSLKTCLKYFQDGPLSILEGQRPFVPPLDTNPHLKNILASLSEDEKDAFTKRCKSFEGNAAAGNKQVWLSVELHREPAMSFEEKSNYTTLYQETVLQFTYPRLDINVSKQKNHLLKAPFCVHPKTGKVCVPIDVNNLEAFKLDRVPTLAQLVGEVHEGVASLSLRSYEETFRNALGLSLLE